MITTQEHPSWETLARELRPFVARRLGDREHEVDDVLQEVLLRVHRGLPKLQHRDRFHGWVLQIARNSINDQLRQRQRFPLADAEPAESAAPESEEQADRAVAAALAQSLSFFVAVLPGPYRETLQLVELDGVSYQDAADRLGVSLSAIKSRVSRGRTKLRSYLEACCEIALDARGTVRRCEPRTKVVMPEDCCR